MRSTNLLSTSTVTFQDLLGNGKSFKVPPYQRDYSWTQEEWEDLWLDVEDQRTKSEGSHYMGAVVLKAENDRTFTIIDGQQRIATLSILALATIKKLEELGGAAGDADNVARAAALRNRFIGEKDPVSLLEISKLTLNEHDDGFFRDYLVQLRSPFNPRSLRKSNRLLWDCFSYYFDRIGDDATLASDGQALAELLSETVARRLLFIQIVVDDEMSAYTVFETLNARGLQLTTTDLLKNYLFSRLKTGSDLEAVQRRWHSLLLTVRQDRFGEFLRYHYLTLHRKIRTGRLFKLVRDEVKSPQEVLDLLTLLESRAELFEALSDPTHSLWSSVPDARPLLAQLTLFRVRQMTPLLFAAYERMSSDDFVRVLKFVVAVSFRYSVISALNTNDLEPTYHDAAKAVLNGQAASPRRVFEVLKPIYVPDEKFRADFSVKSMSASGPRKRLVKYILAAIESDLGNEVNFDTDPATIEHILPENPGEPWEAAFPSDTWEEWIDRLGNQTLLSATANRELGDGTYLLKVEAYGASDYLLTRNVTAIAPNEWTPAILEKRQREMASRALRIWRADFA